MGTGIWLPHNEGRRRQTTNGEPSLRNLANDPEHAFSMVGRSPGSSHRKGARVCARGPIGGNPEAHGAVPVGGDGIGHCESVYCQSGLQLSGDQRVDYADLGQQEFAAVVRMGEVYSKSANFEAFRTILSEKEKSVSDFRLSFNLG